MIREDHGAVVARLGGDTPVGYRERIAKSFLDPNGVGVILVQDSLGIGIKLTSNYLIRTSYPLDYAAYEQSNERIYDGPDQNRTFIELEAQRTVSQWARRICTTKDVAQRALLQNAPLSEVLGVSDGKLNLALA